MHSNFITDRKNECLEGFSLGAVGKRNGQDCLGANCAKAPCLLMLLQYLDKHWLTAAFLAGGFSLCLSSLSLAVIAGDKRKRLELDSCAAQIPNQQGLGFQPLGNYIPCQLCFSLRFQNKLQLVRIRVNISHLFSPSPASFQADCKHYCLIYLPGSLCTL